MLNSKLATDPCKQFCFYCKIDPKHDQNFKEDNFGHFFLNSASGFIYTYIAHTCTRESAVSVHTTFRGPRK